MRRPARAAVLLAFLVGSSSTHAASPTPDLSAFRIDVRSFQPIEGPSSGPEVYYHIVDGTDGSFLRGVYRPGMESVTMGAEVPEELRSRVRRVRWRWRALALPQGGDECRAGRGDSAASVALAFKRGLKWYILKYVWSSVGPLGGVCDRKRTLLLVRDTIVLESGGAPGSWLVEMVDVRQAYIDHFAGGNPRAEVPDLVGIGVMTDGDQTRSTSAADWADFELQY